jgi:diaminopimelate epimerase
MGWGALEKPIAVNVGNPHLVFFVPDPRLVELVNIGPSIEHDPVFPERINVNVASVGEHGIDLRTWERGSGLTRACGTGACATAVAAIASKRATSPVKVSMKGGSLTIGWQPGGEITMRGGATHIFKGEIDLESFRP